METRHLIFEQIIEAPIAQLYNAFTNASTLREWLCDIATVDPRQAGRIYLAWRTGYYACGEYLLLEPEKQIRFTWRGRNDPASSEVQIRLETSPEGVRLRLEHLIPGKGDVWEKTTDEIERGWQESLENLASVLQTGIDLRFVRRPMLGISISDFNSEIAKKLQVPVERGVRIDSVVNGMGAQAAGLRSGDVIIRMDGYEINSFVDLPVAISGKRAGDRIEVVYYRGPLEMRTNMELSQRPLPEIPSSVEELTSAARSIYEKDEAILQELLADVGEKEAEHRPAPQEWNVKEILAHLIHGERGWHKTVVEIAANQESWLDEWGGNQNFYVSATVEAYPTLSELKEAYLRAHRETLAIYARLPQELLQRKGSFWRIAFSAVDQPTHFDAHLDQIKATIAAAQA